MRDMAKKAQSMREKKAADEDRNGKKRQSREYRGRSSRQRNKVADQYAENPEENYHQNENTELNTVNTSQEEQAIQDQMIHATPSSRMPDIRRSPDKVSRDSGVISPSEADSATTECSDMDIGVDNQDSNFQLDINRATNFLSVKSTPTNGLTKDIYPNNGLKENNQMLPQQRPVSNLQNTLMMGGSRRPSDPLPYAPEHQTLSNPNLSPVKAELVTNELDNDNIRNTIGNQDIETIFHNLKKIFPGSATSHPPPYHIAAAMSKHAQDFSNLHRPSHNQEEEHYYENQVRQIVALKEKNVYLCCNKNLKKKRLNYYLFRIHYTRSLDKVHLWKDNLVFLVMVHLKAFQNLKLPQLHPAYKQLSELPMLIQSISMLDYLSMIHPLKVQLHQTITSMAAIYPQNPKISKY